MIRVPLLNIRQRIWLMLALAILPLFVLTITDYLNERRNRLADFEEHARLMLSSLQIAEIEQQHQVESLLKTFAGANEMQNPERESCSALARRLKQAHPNIASLGAVDAQGEVFCSAVQQQHPVNVSDRPWFQETITQHQVSRGQFLIGRISGLPGVTFGFALRAPDGTLRGTLFASTKNIWFDRFASITALPEEWTSLLLTRDGQPLSRYPDPEQWRDKSLPAESLQHFKAALAAGKNTVRMIGLDGVDRLFVLRPLQIANGELISTVGVPVEKTLALVEREFRQRLFIVLALITTSVLVAYRLLGGLIDRKFSENLEALQTMKMAMDKVPAYVFIKDKEGHYQYANGQALAFLGVSADTVTGKVDHDFFSDDTAARIRAVDQSVLAGKEPVTQLDEVDGPAGKRYYHQIKTPILDEKSGQVWGVIGISTDVTEQQLAVEQIRKLSRAIEQSPNSILFTNLNAEIEYVNESFCTISGYSREEVIGQNPRILHSGKTPKERYTAMWLALQRGEQWQGEFINRRKDGSDYLESIIISPLRDEQGKTTHYIALKQDITEQRENEQELARYRENLEKLVQQRTDELAIAKESAEAANHAKSRFLANMSHEIRTPLNVIIGLNHLLQKTLDQPQQLDRSHKIDQSAHHLLAIINDILDLSRIEAGRMELEVHPFAPREVLHDVTLMIRERAEAKGLAVSVDFGQLPARLLGDATRLRQVLLNFAGNAVKFTQHGQIALRAEVLNEDEKSTLCKFSVHDSGIGIRNDQLARLFQAFEQVDSSSTRPYEGSGLGLAISKHLARLMGGEVGAESTEGVGSTFWLTVPFAACLSDHEAQPSAGCHALQGCVLLVEDDLITREVGIDLLQASGLMVQAVENGQQAVDAVRSHKFDLILMDLQMPVLDGIGATQAIRQLIHGQTVPIVALTANAFAENRKQCFDAGMNDFLSKPVTAARLHATLRKYLQEAPIRRDHEPQQAMLPSNLNEALAQLHTLLRFGNIEANRLFLAIRPAIQAEDTALAAQLSHLIETYNYDAAILLLASLSTRLAGQHESLAGIPGQGDTID